MGDITKKLMRLTRHKTKPDTMGERTPDMGRSSGASTIGIPETESDPGKKEDR